MGGYSGICTGCEATIIIGGLSPGCSVKMSGEWGEVWENSGAYFVCGNVNLPAADWGGGGSYSTCASQCQACQSCEAACQTGSQLVSDYVGGILTLGNYDQQEDSYDIQPGDYIEVNHWNELIKYINSAADIINSVLDNLIDKGDSSLKKTIIGTELKDYTGKDGKDQIDESTDLGGKDIKGSTQIDSTYIKANKITNSKDEDGTSIWAALPEKSSTEIITADDFNMVKEMLGKFKYKDTFTGESTTMAEEGKLLNNIKFNKYNPTASVGSRYAGANIFAERLNSLVDIVNEEIKIPKVIPTPGGTCVKCQFKQTGTIDK